MKIRNGFVSNSSSSSFMISLDNITGRQLKQIKSHKLKCGYGGDEWTISVTEDYVSGSTYMDNFDMSEYLEEIGVDPNVIQWDNY